MRRGRWKKCMILVFYPLEGPLFEYENQKIVYVLYFISWHKSASHKIKYIFHPTRPNLDGKTFE
jgi:hypothetical protein